MAKPVSQEVRKQRALEGIDSACRQQRFPQSMIEAIVEEAERIMASSDIGDPVGDLRQQLTDHLRNTQPDLWLAHKPGLECFAAELAEREPQRWAKLCLTAGFMYGAFIHYCDSRGRVDVARTDDLLERMEAEGLIQIDYLYAEDDENGDEEDSVEIEKSDIPAPGEVGISPLTGKPDQDFHDKIVRHFKIGKSLLALAG